MIDSFLGQRLSVENTTYAYSSIIRLKMRILNCPGQNFVMHFFGQLKPP